MTSCDANKAKREMKTPETKIRRKKSSELTNSNISEDDLQYSHSFLTNDNQSSIGTRKHTKSKLPALQ